MYSMHQSVSRYRDALVTSVDTREEPHRVVTLLLAGAIERVRLADLAMAHGDVLKKNQSLRSAIQIIDALRGSLDHQAGGNIASGLESLYEYMGLRLIEANISNNRTYTEEVVRLLSEIAGAWGAISPQIAVAAAH